MPIECRWWDHNPYDDPDLTPLAFDGHGSNMQGICWFNAHPGWPGLSEHYLDVVQADRLPIWVLVPTRTGGAVDFCIDSHPTGKPTEGWNVEVDLGTLVHGMRPDITVAPSINCVGLYHGFLQHGVLTDDLG